MLMLLRWTCAALLFGRAWQHLRWDPPYRALLWSQETMEGAVTFLLGMTWEAFATSPAVGSVITGSIQLLGGFLILGGIAALACTPARRWTHVVLILSGILLTFLAYVTYLDRLLRIGEFVEHAAQFSMPIILALWTRDAISRATLIHTLRLVIACTFVGHGLYAVGVYPTPGDWVTMTMLATGFGEEAALQFLWIAGILDFVVAGALVSPPLARPALIYAAVWGLLTALARVVAFVEWDNFAGSTSQWLFETLVRLPHAVLPLVLLWLLRAPSSSFPVRTPNLSETPTTPPQ